MTRAWQTALGLFVMLFVAGAVNAVLITAAPEEWRAPWIVWAGTGAVAVAAALIWWKVTARPKR